MTVTFTLIPPASPTPDSAASTIAIACAASLAGKDLLVTSEKESEPLFSAYPRPTLIVNEQDAKPVALFETRACLHYLLSARGHCVDGVDGICVDSQDLSLDDAVFEHLPEAKLEALVASQLSMSRKVQLFAFLYGRRVEGKVAAWFEDFRSSDAIVKALSKLTAEILDAQASCVRHIRAGVEYSYDWTKERLPVPGERNILITSALPYVNNVPHLGNIVGAVLSADVYARFCRLRGYNTLYICGTDEYGTATETKALEEGVDCQAICDKYFKIHKEVYDWFQIDFDHFGRSSTPEQTRITHGIFRRLYDNGFFFEDSVEQTFCERCDRFLADRYVEGECPLCGFADARGDQCDGCGKLLNAVELKKPRCKICRSEPIVKSSRHLFLDLTALQSKCDAFVEDASKVGRWSSNSASIAKAWLSEGLKPRCMTRDLRWGTSVPLPDFADKVFYVWFDAPIGYLSITAAYTENWELWWKNPANVQLYQFMGKDNVPFHTVIFPSTLLGTGDEYTLLHHINTTEYLNYESGKFSKSRGIGVFGTDARDTGIPSDVWRYFLLASRPENADSVFTWDDFSAKTNTELLANLGNFVSRVTKFVKAKCAGRIAKALFTDADHVYVAKINEELNNYTEALEQVKIRAGLRHIMAISALGNAYLTENKLDSALLSADPVRCGSVLAVAINTIYLLSVLFEPFLPTTSANLCNMLNAPPRKLPATFELDLLEGHTIGTPFHLFSRIEEQTLKELKVRFAGKQK